MRRKQWSRLKWIQFWSTCCGARHGRLLCGANFSRCDLVVWTSREEEEVRVTLLLCPADLQVPQESYTVHHDVKLFTGTFNWLSSGLG